MSKDDFKEKEYQNSAGIIKKLKIKRNKINSADKQKICVYNNLEMEEEK